MKRKCSYDGCTLDGAGECRKCEELIMAYSKEKIEGTSGPATKEMIRRAEGEEK